MNKTIILTKENIDHVLGYMHTILVGTKVCINSHNFPEVSIEEIIDIEKVSFLETGDTENTIYLKVVWKDGWCTIDTGVTISFNSKLGEFKFVSGTDMTTVKLIDKEIPIILDKNNIEAVASYLTFNMVGNTYSEDNTTPSKLVKIINLTNNNNNFINIQVEYDCFKGKQNTKFDGIIKLGAKIFILDSDIKIYPYGCTRSWILYKIN